MTWERDEWFKNALRNTQTQFVIGIIENKSHLNGLNYSVNNSPFKEFTIIKLANDNNTKSCDKKYVHLDKTFYTVASSKEDESKLAQFVFPFHSCIAEFI